MFGPQSGGGASLETVSAVGRAVVDGEGPGVMWRVTTVGSDLVVDETNHHGRRPGVSKSAFKS